MAQDSNNDKEKTIHYESGVAIFSPPPKDQDAEQRAERRAARTYEDRQIAIQNRILWTQIALVLFGVIGAGVGIWQAKTAQESSDTAQISVLLAQKTQRESRKATEQQARQSDNVLKANIENFHVEQRAWVGVQSAAPIMPGPDGRKIYIRPNSPPAIPIVLLNSGKTPALKVSVRAASEIVKMGTEPNTTYTKATKGWDHAKGVVQPNGNAFLEIPYEKGILDATTVDAIIRGTSVMYFYGFINYEDVFGGKHQTTFCFFMNQTIDSAFTCNTYNEAN